MPRPPDGLPRTAWSTDATRSFWHRLVATRPSAGTAQWTDRALWPHTSLVIELPPDHRSALISICDGHRRDEFSTPWAAEAAWGAEVLGRLRAADLVRLVNETALSASWWGWLAALPEEIAEYKAFVLALQQDVRAGRERSEVAPHLGQLLRHLPPIHGLQVDLDAARNPTRLTITAHQFVQCSLDHFNAPMSDARPLHVVAALHAYGARTFTRAHTTTLPIPGADFSDATFTSSIFGGDLSRVCFDRCTFDRCVFSGAWLADASFRNARFTRCDIQPSDLRGAVLEGAAFGDHCRLLYPDLAHATWEVLHFDGRPLFRTGPAPLALERRPLGWEIVVRGRRYGSWDLRSMPVLAGLVRHAGKEIHVLDAEAWIVDPDREVAGAPTRHELPDLAARAGLTVAERWIGSLDERAQWRLAAIARRTLLLAELATRGLDRDLRDERDELRRYVADQVQVSGRLPQGPGPVKVAVGRVCRSLEELVEKASRADRDLAALLDGGLARQEFLRWDPLTNPAARSPA